MSDVLIFSPDAIPMPGELAAGPGIRYFEMAASLVRAGHKVRLAVPSDVYKNADLPGITLQAWTPDRVSALANTADVVILPHVHGELSRVYAAETRPDLPTVVDLYDPVLVENLGLQEKSQAGLECFLGYLSDVLPILRRGDLFLYANQRQRYYYLGVLNALARINPLTYESQLLVKVPFGVSSEPPELKGGVIKGSLVDKDDKVILWFSGIYPWFDARTLVRAMPLVLQDVPNAKLLIMGGVHPRGHAPDSEYKATIAEAENLGLLGSSVLPVDWQPYDQRASWYADADIAVATHKDSLEMELSHRTRIIDFLWAGLPVITSAGDEVGRFVEEKGCGRTVPIGEPTALAQVLVEVLSDPDTLGDMAIKANETAHRELTWDNVCRPLTEFCASPRLAADRRSPEAMERQKAFVPLAKESPMIAADGSGVTSSLVGKVKRVYLNEGAKAVFRKAAGYAERKFKEPGS